MAFRWYRKRKYRRIFKKKVSKTIETHRLSNVDRLFKPKKKYCISCGD